MPTIKLDFPPSSNRYWRRGPHGTYISKEARQYRDKVAQACIAQRIMPISGPVILTVYAAMPATNRDLGNTEKILSDALQGYLFSDDVQIIAIHMYRCDAPKPKKQKAHVMVMVECAQPIMQTSVFERMFPNGKKAVGGNYDGLTGMQVKIAEKFR